ncbi:MAG: glycosyltransferase family 4 protein [Patescibacteria group bacterium]
MNILVLSWRDPKHPLAGGAEQVMHEHMKGWVKAGHKVTLFSSKFKSALNEENLDGITILRKGDQFIGVKIQAFLYWIKNKEKFDLVVDQFHGIPFFTPLYVKKPKLAVLQEVAKEVWFMNELPIPFNWLVGFIGFVFEPLIFLFYKNIPFMIGSKSAKEDLLTMKIPFNNINIVPHGVIVEKLKTVPKKERVKTICFLGALAKDKGIEDALKSFSILNKKDKFNFWVIGRGSPEYKTYLLTLCEKYGIIDRVKFWDYVDNKKKFELLARAHILVNPSKREGWGLVNIEANSMGTPVVAYKSTGLIDSVKNGLSGAIVGKNTPKDLAETIVLILDDNSAYSRLQRGAINWGKKFNWEKSWKKSLKLINGIA